MNKDVTCCQMLVVLEEEALGSGGSCIEALSEIVAVIQERLASDTCNPQTAISSAHRCCRRWFSRRKPVDCFFQGSNPGGTVERTPDHPHSQDSSAIFLLRTPSLRATGVEWPLCSTKAKEKRGEGISVRSTQPRGRCATQTSNRTHIKRPVPGLLVRPPACPSPPNVAASISSTLFPRFCFGRFSLGIS